MRLFRVLFCSWVVASGFAHAQDRGAGSSPFSSSGSTQGAAEASQSFEFTGVVATAARTLICVTSTADRRSRWIPLEGRLEGIKVTSYDPVAQQIVIETGGRTHTLALKRPTARANIAPPAAPPPVAAMPLPMPPPANAGANIAQAMPTTNEEKEREARMLVSDLLEIGMIQRKAYEEAQRKEAEAKKNGGASTSPAPAPDPTAPRQEPQLERR
jgi:hypothetical protein